MSASVPREFDAAVGLLGGGTMFSPAIQSVIDAHRAILKSFSERALAHLTGQVEVMRQPVVFEKVVGTSMRAFQRRRKIAATRSLTPEQSSRVWKFARMLTRAMRVFGLQEEAERWLSCPATGLNHLRPIDLLATSAGFKIVQHHLMRLEYCT